jgi:hypothetical protein
MYFLICRHLFNRGVVVTGCFASPQVGTFVNGVALHSWSDGRSLHGLWNYVAMEMDLLDFDICLGTVNANNEYHREQYLSILLLFLVSHTHSFSLTHSLAYYYFS